MGKEYFVILTTPTGKTRSGKIRVKHSTIKKLEAYFQSIGFEFMYTDPLQIETTIQRRKN